MYYPNMWWKKIKLGKGVEILLIFKSQSQLLCHRLPEKDTTEIVSCIRQNKEMVNAKERHFIFVVTDVDPGGKELFIHVSFRLW